MALCRLLLRIKPYLLNHTHRFSGFPEPSDSLIHKRKIQNAILRLKSKNNHHINPEEQILYSCLSNIISHPRPPSSANPIHTFLYELNTQPPLMYIFLEKLKAKPQFQNETMFSNIIRVYGQSRMFSHALGTFENMHAKGITRSVESLNALLAASLSSRNIDNLIKIFMDYPTTYGVTQNSGSYKILISGLVKYGDNKENTKRKLEYMIENEIGDEPDQNMYKELMEYLCDCEDQDSSDHSNERAIYSCLNADRVPLVVLRPSNRGQSARGSNEH